MSAREASPGVNQCRIAGSPRERRVRETCRGPYDGAMSLVDLQRLSSAWSQKYPKQAEGGESALMGFAFQCQAVLLASVRAWLESTLQADDDPMAFCEVLSDLAVRKDDGVLVVSQLKYTQSSGMVISALGDLFRIDQVAVSDTPDLLPKLRFRILSARPHLKSVQGTIDDWAPKGVALNDPALVAFKGRLVAEIQDDPEGELLALLANKLHAQRPLTTSRAWQGDLLAASLIGKSAFEQVALRIWNDLRAMKEALRHRPADIVAWTAADRAPEDVARGRVLIGQQPGMRNLREGYFAPREALTQRLAARAAEWIDAQGAEEDDTLRLPLFWIGGRSGTGKSVMLLQLLARLHEQGHVSILLPSSVRQLPAAIAWARELGGPGRRVLIGIDDPHAPADQGDALGMWSKALDELHAARQSGEAWAIPLILCCGPTEQAEQLGAEMTDGVSVHIEALPDETPADIAELREWYRQRTGKEPPPVGDDNVLLVQLFFEWRTKTGIGAFASRLQDRIRRRDPSGTLETALAHILAINRLYCGANRLAIEASLSDTMLDALDRLRANGHLEDDPSVGRPGLWLGHPHLAEAVYAHWFPPDRSKRQRVGHLKAAVLGALHHGTTPSGQTGPLWAISRAIGPLGRRGDVAERLNEDEAVQVLTEVHAEVRAAGEIGWSHLPAWVQLDACLPTLKLKPRPIAVAMQRLAIASGTETGLWLTCRKLLEHSRTLEPAARPDAVIEAILALLDRLPEWRDWSSVAEDVIAHTGSVQVLRRIEAWLPSRLPRPAPQRLLARALVLAGPGETSLHRLALESLASAKVTDGWCAIGSVLLDADWSRPAVLDWMAVRHKQLKMAPLLLKLIELREPRALTWALAWTGQHHRRPVANRMLEALCDRSKDDRVIPWALAWLEAGHPHSTLLLSRLIEIDPHRTRDVGMRWLERTPMAARAWSFGWEAMWRRWTRDTALKDVAFDWLARVPIEHPAWNFFLRRLIDHYPTDDALWAKGLEWLQATPCGDSNWPGVLQVMCESRDDASDLNPQSLRWLSQRGDDPQWSFLWHQAWDMGADRTVLIGLGAAWLESAPASVETWFHLWRVLWKARPGDVDLAAKAIAWLADVCPPDAGFWASVWLYVRREKAVEPLRGMALAWLRAAASDEYHWPNVWRALWDGDPGDVELIQRGNAWLAEGVTSEFTHRVSKALQGR